ncbi:hypothetical protein GCM10020295_12420 [Streptomyces cinereospinus]
MAEASAAAGDVHPVTTPGTHSRRTGRKPGYVPYRASGRHAGSTHRTPLRHGQTLPALTH